MGDVALDRVLFGLITLPFVIFAFVRIFIKENRRNDELFYDRAKTEINALRAHCDALEARLDHKDREFDQLERRMREERNRCNRLEDEVFALKARLGLDPNTQGD